MGTIRNLVAFDFQLGRYLMIAGSRPGSQPLNLQGKWNRRSIAAAWDSKMTLNINEEMNYWGAEECNLSECTLPLFDMIEDLAESGNKVALDTYFVTNNCSFATNGWVAHHNTDLWRAARGQWQRRDLAFGRRMAVPALWWHFLYTGDTNWLATTGYPLMLGAAHFSRAFSARTWEVSNWWVTCPSYSPEHNEGSPYNVANFPVQRWTTNSVVICSTTSCRQPGLGNDAAYRYSDITTLMGQIAAGSRSAIGEQFQEWLDYDDATYDAGHRHCSHLVGFYPGDEISTYYTPALAAAAKQSVDLRGYG